jgi:hypothetical protein
MVILEEKNTRGQSVGFHNTEGGFYQTTRDFDKGQIFYQLKGHPIAIDKEILKNCIKIAYDNHFTPETYKIRFLIKNFEKEDFIGEISLKEFLAKSEEFSFDKRKDGQNFTGYGVQRRIQMQHLIRIYQNQEILQQY